MAATPMLIFVRSPTSSREFIKMKIVDIDSQLNRSENFQEMKKDLSAVREALESLLKIEENREKEKRWQ